MTRNGGSRILQRGAKPKGEAPAYYSTKFSLKLYENEEIWTEGEGGRGAVRPKFVYVATVKPLKS